MALEAAGAFVLKIAVTELLNAVVKAKEKTSNSQQALTRLECTLTSVIPRVKHISRLNKKLNIPDVEMKELITILQNGKALVDKCPQVSSINLVRKGQYSKQLFELDYSLLRYFHTILPLDHIRDTKEIRLMVRELHGGLVGVKDEGESSKLMEDEDSEIQSCQDPKEIETMKQVIDTEEKKVNWGTKTWKDRLKGWLYNFDMENTTSLIEENVPEIEETTSLIEENVPEIEEIKEGKDTWKFRLKGCIYNFDMKDKEYYCTDNGSLLGREKRRYNVTHCGCSRHAKVRVMRYEEVVMQYKERGWWKISDEKMVEKNEFVYQMKTLRNVGNHPNIFPPIGYCFHFSGTFLFFDDIPLTSLYSKLHEIDGRRGIFYERRVRAPELKGIDKVKIFLGVARGISHLHSVGFVHGNLNSSNVLLTSGLDSYISAYGLKYFSSANQQLDVHSFGLLLIEMLSRRIPSEEMPEVHRMDWKNWRDYCNRPSSDWPGQDSTLLHIAMKCVNKRPRMEDVVLMIEKIVV